VLSVWTERRKPGKSAGNWGNVDIIEPVAVPGDGRMLLAFTTSACGESSSPQSRLRYC